MKNDYCIKNNIRLIRLTDYENFNNRSFRFINEKEKYGNISLPFLSWKFLISYLIPFLIVNGWAWLWLNYVYYGN